MLEEEEEEMKAAQGQQAFLPRSPRGAQTRQYLPRQHLPAHHLSQPSLRCLPPPWPPCSGWARQQRCSRSREAATVQLVTAVMVAGTAAVVAVTTATEVVVVTVVETGLVTAMTGATLILAAAAA